MFQLNLYCALFFGHVKRLNIFTLVKVVLIPFEKQVKHIIIFVTVEETIVVTIVLLMF